MCAGIIESWLTVPHGSASLLSLDPASAVCGWPSCLPRLLGGGQELSSSTQWEPGILPTPPLPRGVRPQSLQFPEPGGSGLPNVPSCPDAISFPCAAPGPSAQKEKLLSQK